MESLPEITAKNQIHLRLTKINQNEVHRILSSFLKCAYSVTMMSNIKTS